MNKALGYYAASMLCATAGIVLCLKGDRALKRALRDQERETWHKAEVESREGPTMSSAQTADLNNGVSER